MAKAKPKSEAKLRADAAVAKMPPISPPISIAQLVQLLSPGRRFVEVGHLATQPVTPLEQVIRIQRGRLQGAITVGMTSPYYGARANRTNRTQLLTPVLAVRFAIRCERALRTTSWLPDIAFDGESVRVLTKQPAHMLGPVADLLDTERNHAMLCGELLAHLAGLPLDIPVAVLAYQSWKLGFSPIQVHVIERVAGRAEAIFDYLNASFRFDPRTFSDALDSRACYGDPAPAAQVVRKTSGPAGNRKNTGSRSKAKGLLRPESAAGTHAPGEGVPELFEGNGPTSDDVATTGRG